MEPQLLATRSLKDARLLRILAGALESVEPGRLVRAALAQMDLGAARHIYLLGIGKAAEPMTFAAAGHLGRYARGLVITKHASGRLEPEIAVMEGSHPVPDERSLQAGRAALEFVASLGPDDLLVCLVSGGGSALAAAPRPGVTLQAIRSTTAAMLAGGAPITEINRWRQSVDEIKAGGLARATRARVITLIVSDIPGGGPELIASGPTVDAALGARATNVIIGDLKLAADAAVRLAGLEGFESRLLELGLHGEASDCGRQLAEILHSERLARRQPFCLIAGGETTVTINGQGRGGRNQELALAAVDVLAGSRNVLLVALATDGEDGPTDAAGAVVNGETRARALNMGLVAAEHLARNDSHAFFEPLGDLIRPGATATNVNDLIFLFGL
jgi:glycerate 2-kinase